jgi:hypothetical protein
MLLSRAGLAGAPAIKLGSPMNVEMPLVELDDLARSARALQLHAAGPASPMSPPPGIDQQVLAYAREMFVDGPGWPVLPPRLLLNIPPSNLQLFVAAEVVEFLFRHEKGRFEVAAGQWLTQSEARGYLLAGQSGRGMLTSAQAAHDIGVKAAKQVAKAQEDAKRAGKAARKRAPEAARDAAAAAARNAVWDERFGCFANISGVAKLGLPPLDAASRAAGYRAWKSGPSYRAASAAEEEKTAVVLAAKALADLQPPPPPPPPCHPPPAAAAASPVTDETPRHIRLRPSPSAEEVHEVEVFILQKEMYVMEHQAEVDRLHALVEGHGDPDLLPEAKELQNKLLELTRGLMKRINELDEKNLELLEENCKLKLEVEGEGEELEGEGELEGEESEEYHTMCEVIEDMMGGRWVTTWVPHEST